LDDVTNIIIDIIVRPKLNKILVVLITIS